MRVPDSDLKVWLRGLLDADARLHGAPDWTGLGGLHRWRLSRTGRLAEAVVIVDAMGVGRPLAPHGTGTGG